jgi:ERF superfamily
MQRTSESIGTLAAALAKAQLQLTNPEKSLVATIRKDGPGGMEETFRYAPLSSGLDIVRKTLGDHEIATVQTTSIDQTTGIVNLTTVLAHASGEWIASDWPVCPISETATPHRMGAALTYARRYALFTLVGIAGEDDLDAPDLATPTSRTSGPEKPKAGGDGQLNGGQRHPAQRTALRRHARNQSKPTTPVLEPEASAELRDRLIAELNDLDTGDDAALWAHRHLPEKNRLTAADAQRVEECFQARLAGFVAGADLPKAPQAARQPKRTRSSLHDKSAKRKKSQRPDGIDKTILTFPEPRRIRDREHVKSVARHPCLVCGRRPADAHHLRFAQNPALGRKVSDEFTVPLCRGHHREVHRAGDEAAWWNRNRIDPLTNARALWLKTHPLPTHLKEIADPARSGRPRTDSNGRNGKSTSPAGAPNYETKPIVADGPASLSWRPRT